jgi:hypothetical protein
MLTMGIEHYNQPHAIFFVLEVSNAFFTTVFGLGKSITFPSRQAVKVFWSSFGSVASILIAFSANPITS